MQSSSRNFVKYERQKFDVIYVETLKIINFRYYFRSQYNYNLHIRVIITVIFIDILIHLKVLKNTLISIKFNTKIYNNKSK